MMFIIIDLESTCSKKDHEPLEEREIIEIGAVVLDENNTVIAESQFLVRPVVLSGVTEFCTRLTGITRCELAHAGTFADVFPSFVSRLEAVSRGPVKNHVLCSWGDYDRRHLEVECKRYELTYPFGPYVNIKSRFAEKQKIAPLPLSKALELLNLEFDGNAHRGLDDARNIARVVTGAGLNLSP